MKADLKRDTKASKKLKDVTEALEDGAQVDEAGLNWHALSDGRTGEGGPEDLSIFGRFLVVFIRFSAVSGRFGGRGERANGRANTPRAQASKSNPITPPYRQQKWLLISGGGRGGGGGPNWPWTGIVATLAAPWGP